MSLFTFKRRGKITLVWTFVVEYTIASSIKALICPAWSVVQKVLNLFTTIEP